MSTAGDSLIVELSSGKDKIGFASSIIVVCVVVVGLSAKNESKRGGLKLPVCTHCATLCLCVATHLVRDMTSMC